MLPAVLRHQQLLAPGSMWRPFFEVPGPHGGIVDLVWVRFSRAALSGRPPAAAPLDLTSLRALQALNAAVPIDQLASYAGVSHRHLVGSVLPRLLDAGWVERAGSSWVASRRYRPAATRVIAVELKRDDWRSALKQASRHRAAADGSWVVLDARRARTAAAAAIPFAHAGVGLAALSLCDAADTQTSQLSIIHQTGRLNDAVNAVGRAFFGEQCLHMWRQGMTSGPERHVFGRFLEAASR